MAYSVPSTHQLDQVVLVDLDSTGVATAQHEPGYTVRSDDGKTFLFVKYDSSGVAAVAGAPVVWQKTTAANGYVVTADLSDGGEEAFAGVACAVLADTKYGWIQSGGVVPDAAESTAVSAGDALKLDTSQDQIFETGLTTDNIIVAYALEDDSSGVGDVILKNTA